MNKNILDRLDRETGVPGLAQILSERLSASDLNALLLDVFASQTAQLTPADLMRAYRKNRFVQPATVDPIAFTTFCLDWLQAARAAGFQPIQLSPVSPLGTCSAVATASQHKVISALRGTEVVADATNVLAMESTLRRSEQGYPDAPLHFSVVHRHVRAQEIPNIPGFSAHFSIIGLTSAGRDSGNFDFEKENLRRHIGYYKSCFEKTPDCTPVKIRLKALDTEGKENRLFRSVLTYLEKTEPGWLIEVTQSKQSEQEYYRGLQFKIVIPKPFGDAPPSHAAANSTEEMEIADGGFTDWTQRLSGNLKERLLISGMGLELLFKMLNGLA